MARPRSDSAPDLAKPRDLSAGLIDRLTCPVGKAQAFLRDTKVPGLRVRVTRTGAKSFVYERSLRNRTLRVTLGDARVMSIDSARQEALRLALVAGEGIDPRELERQQLAERAAEAQRRAAERAAAEAKQAAEALTVGAVWARYVAERRPHWGERNYTDHLKLAQAGGVPRKRLEGTLTKPGPLAPLMGMRLVDLRGPAVERWATAEAKDRPARVRLALRALKAFLRWAAAEPDLQAMVDPTAADARKAREAAGRSRPKDDYLQREQLKAWFAAVRAIPNPVIAAYLQVLLLTGARREELGGLRWEDVNWQWKGLDLRDKVEGRRAVPLTPYVAQLLEDLPRRNEWVFSSAQTVALDPKNARRRSRRHAARGTEAPAGPVAERSASGRLVEPSIAHRKACAAAGLEGLTLHGLRRSFASLSEWLEVPVGVVAQVMGHKPSATAERHYKRRPLDLLRVHHERIEAWVLEQAGVEWKPKAEATEAPRLAAVS